MSPKTLWKDPLHDYKYGAVHESVAAQLKFKQALNRK